MPISDETLIRLVEDGWSYAKIARCYGYSSNDTVRGMYHRALRRKNGKSASLTQASAGWKPVDASALSDYDQTPEISAPVLVLSDIHFPTTDYEFLDLALVFGEKHMPSGKRNVLLLGDVVNFDALSIYPHVSPPYSLSLELDIAEAFLVRLTKTFDNILYVQGNHEDRLRKSLDPVFYGHRFMRLLVDDIASAEGKIQVSMATRAQVVGSSAVWRATHQKNYSRTQIAVGSALAQKYSSNIIAAHQHFVGIFRAPYGDYTIINSGGLFDARKMAYVSRVDNTSPQMANGFVFVDAEGAGHLLTPYDSMTSWALWGMTQEFAQFRKSRAKKRQSKSF